MPYNQDIIINTVVVVKTKPLWKQMHINADINRLPTSSQTVWLSATQSTVTVWCAFGWTEPNAGYTVNMPTTSRVWPGPAVCSSLHTSHTLHSHTDDTVHNEWVIRLINYHANNAEYNWVTSADHTWVSVESSQRLTCSVDQRYSIHYCNTAAYKLSTRLSDVSCPICNIRNTRSPSLARPSICPSSKTANCSFRHASLWWFILSAAEIQSLLLSFYTVLHQNMEDKLNWFHGFSPASQIFSAYCIFYFHSFTNFWLSCLNYSMASRKLSVCVFTRVAKIITAAYKDL